MYVTLSEAQEYFEDSLSIGQWLTASTQAQARALRSATRRIDAQPLIGRKLEPSQDHAFPRRYWRDHTDSDVPAAVKAACCEEALSVLQESDDARGLAQAQGVTSVRVGDVSETYTEAMTAQRARDGLSPAARRLLRPWIRRVVTLC